MNPINKRKISVLAAITATSFLSAIIFPVIAQATTFSDISENHQYAIAIDYLSESGIINGYPDGTFQPDRIVSRVEFLKLALESSEIPADISTLTNFSDIDENAWYAKYVRKAKNEGWIEGYQDGTFKPEQGVNKAEALKIIGQVQDWSTKTTVSAAPFKDTAAFAWYTTYIEYADSKNFLDERGDYFIPEAQLSRGKVSEYLFRAYITNKNNEDIFSSSLIRKYPPVKSSTVTETPTELPIQPIYSETSTSNDCAKETETFTSVAPNSFIKEFFDNITLDEVFPNTFYLNEVYFFKGEITNGNYDKAFIFLVPENASGNEDYINYLTAVEGNNFEIPVVFRETGNYKLGLILGNSGESKILDISVLPSLPTPSSANILSSPTSPSVTYENQNTIFSWANNGNDLIKLTFSQGSNSKSLILRQDINSYAVDYEDFECFKTGIISVKAEGAKLSTEAPLKIFTDWASGPYRDFTAAQHNFTQIHTDLISINNFPESLRKVEPITFSGTTMTEIYDESYIIKPDGSVDKIDLSSSKVKSEYFGSPTITNGSNYTFSYNPATTGIYLIEINSIDGSAVINAPVYINVGIPLIPDFFDLNKLEVTELSEETFDLNKFRNTLLSLINEERSNTGSGTVRIDFELNNLAQLHSEDMVSRNFFGHVNPDNETPDDRRIKLKIPTEVGENLASAPTILYAHNGLMQSGIHRENTLNPEWTRVGIGIAQSNNDYLIITEEFSANKLTENDLTNFKGNTLSEINAKRSQMGLVVMETHGTLAQIADEWSQKMVDENFFNFTSPNGESLSNIVINTLPNNAVQALILEANSIEKLMEEILLSNEIVQNQWEKIGLGLKVDEIGKLKATILFTTH